MEASMITSDIRAKYKRLSSEERRGFNKWLQGCIVVGSILGAGLVAMAVAGLRSPQSDAVMRLAPSVQEQHELAHLKNLPAHPLEDMTFVFTTDHLAQPSLSVSSSDNTAKQ
jgi:hypothetical protein